MSIVSYISFFLCYNENRIEGYNMENNYDVIILGGGSAGLIAGLTLQKKGKKVLILEKESIAGGCATSFKRGRFEFEVIE